MGIGDAAGSASLRMELAVFSTGGRGGRFCEGGGVRVGESRAGVCGLCFGRLSPMSVLLFNWKDGVFESIKKSHLRDCKGGHWIIMSHRLDMGTVKPGAPIWKA